MNASDSTDWNSLFPDLLEQFPLAVVVTDFQGTIQFVNRAFTVHTGYTAAEAIGQTPRVLKSGNVPRSVYEELWKTVLAGQVWSGDLENQDKQGRLFWEHAVIFPMLDRSGAVRYLVAVKELISRQRVEENRLLDSGYRIKELLRRMPMPMALLSPRGEIWHLNLALAKLLGDDPEAFFGRSIADFLPPGAEEAIRYYGDPWTRESSRRIEHPLINSRGETLEVLAEGSRVLGADDEEEKMVILTNVTVEKRTRNILAAVADVGAMMLKPGALDSLYNTILKRVGEATDVDRVYLFHNHRRVRDGALCFSQIAEWTAEGISPQIGNPDLMDHSYEEDGLGRWGQVLGARKILEGDVSTFPEGERAILEPQEIQSILVVPIFSGTGFWGFIGFDSCRRARTWPAREIDLLRSVANSLGMRLLQEEQMRELAEAKARAEEAAGAAEAANRAKSAFLATMSHEIRTPMNGILGTADIIAQSRPSAEQADLIETIQLSGTSLLQLLDDMLDYSKIEAGKVVIEEKPFDVREGFVRTVDLFRGRARERDLDLTLVIDPSVPPVLMGDLSRLRQILANLISNALKFTDQGHVQVKIGGCVSGEGTFDLRMEVEDTGVGIEPDFYNQIFQVFSQSDTTLTRKTGGSGLGLSICKRIADLMGGALSFDSEVGKGTVFVLRVPLSIGAPASIDPPAMPEINHQDLIDEHQRRLGGKLRILLAEDNLVNQKVARLMLKRLGHSCDLAKDGVEALRAVEKTPYDLVLMDCQMPEMDGYEAARAILSVRPGTPIIALTAAAMQGDYEKAFESGMTDYLTKPIEVSSLARSIEQAATANST